MLFSKEVLLFLQEMVGEKKCIYKVGIEYLDGQRTSMLIDHHKVNDLFKGFTFQGIGNR